MALTQSIETINSKLDTIPVSMGQVIYVRDTKKLFVDSQNGVRIRISDIEECTEAERVSLIAPLNKLYIIKDTKMLWYYSGGWTKLSGSGGGGGSEPTTIIDKVIRTQAQFEELYNSPTWLGATSVAFVGNGGTLKFTRSDGQGIKIPQTVKFIQGINNATIEITNFVYYDGHTGIYYATLPTQDGTISTAPLPGYGISSLIVNSTGRDSTSAGMSGCFENCTQLTNCIGTSTSSANSAYTFRSCTQLTNCIGTGTGINSTGNAYTFDSCTQLTNCIGTGTAQQWSYAFYNCNIVNGCKAGGHCGTAVTGGTMTHVDTATCDWTNPA